MATAKKKATGKRGTPVSLTLTIDSAQAPRIQKALGRVLGLRDPNNNAIVRDATVAEVKQHLADYLRIRVREVEAAVARETAEAGITEITIS